MRKTLHGLVLRGTLLLGVPATHANDASLSAGTHYSVGTYGSRTRTAIGTLPLAVSYRARRWTFAVTVPYLRVRGAGNVIPGTGPVDNRNLLARGVGDLLGDGSTAGARPGAGSTAARTTAAGWGDMVASAGYDLLAGNDRDAGLTLSGTVKFATADVHRGLGTGRNDYALALDGYKRVGRWTPFGGIGWTDYDSSPSLRLRNGMRANAGLDYRLARRDNVGVSYAFRQPIAAGGAAQNEVGAYWTHAFSDRFRLQGEALGGLTRGSPDWGVGTSVSYAF